MTHVFIRKSSGKEVEGFHLTKQNLRDENTWPEWLKRVLSAPVGSIGSLHSVTSKHQWPAQLIAPDGCWTVNENDWLIRDKWGCCPYRPDTLHDFFVEKV